VGETGRVVALGATCTPALRAKTATPALEEDLPLVVSGTPLCRFCSPVTGVSSVSQDSAAAVSLPLCCCPPSSVPFLVEREVVSPRVTDPLYFCCCEATGLTHGSRQASSITLLSCLSCLYLTTLKAPDPTPHCCGVFWPRSWAACDPQRELSCSESVGLLVEKAFSGNHLLVEIQPPCGSFEIGDCPLRSPSCGVWSVVPTWGGPRMLYRRCGIHRPATHRRVEVALGSTSAPGVWGLSGRFA